MNYTNKQLGVLVLIFILFFNLLGFALKVISTTVFWVVILSIGLLTYTKFSTPK
ncbi:MAG TPA: hypothetical protein VKE88_02060 [Candidatus Nanoarchaeia archaeon]|nr:hypothetical protein [Candidatus Nanoarchaeia archaeon]